VALIKDNMNFQLKKTNSYIQRMVLLFLLILNTQFTMAGQPVQLQPSEYEIKAAFIYKFAKFIEWPAGIEQADRDSLIIGILGHDPFGFIMEKVIGGKTVRGKVITVERYHTVDEALQSDILFISESEMPRLDFIINRLSGRDILTVSDTQDFTSKGGMIYLYMHEKHIRFMINIEAASEAQLKFSSKLLKLAEIITSAE